jgi:ADP-ribose pyrophosphatase YjhB (NUDIX family)
MNAERHPEEQRHIEWYEEPVPPGMPVSQAYVWALDPDDGRVLIQDRGPQHPRRYTLPGGRPEPEDGGDPLRTAAREAMEESQVRIDTRRAVYLGHQVLIRDRSRPEPSAQLRYAAPILAYEPIGPDPDNGRINRRFMTDLARAPQLLHWHETGAAQAEAALRAGQELGLPVEDPAPEGYRDGEKSRYLVGRDRRAATGGWIWVHARSAREIRERFAHVAVVTRAEVLHRFAAEDLPEVDIDDAGPDLIGGAEKRS